MKDTFDLRFGSYVASNLHKGLHTEIFGVLDSKTVRLGANPLAMYSVDEITEIPLSIELLEQYGFQKLPFRNVANSMLIDVGRNRHLSIGSAGTPNEVVYLCETNADDKQKIDDLICLHNFDYDGPLYLHVLQNIYRSLAKKELTKKSLLHDRN